MAKTVELKVYGMTCDDCVRHVSGGLKQAEGVTDVSVSLKDGMAVVKAMDTVDPGNLLKLEVFKGQYKAQLKSVKNE